MPLFFQYIDYQQYICRFYVPFGNFENLGYTWMRLVKLALHLKD